MSDKVVDFKELTAENFEGGQTVRENFSLDLVPDSTCDAALEVSVAFQSNSGVINKSTSSLTMAYKLQLQTEPITNRLRLISIIIKGVSVSNSPATSLTVSSYPRKMLKPLNQGSSVIP